MDVGKIIKSARLAKGYTQEELAEKVGVQKSAIAKWENGRVSEIKRSNIKGLADALDIEPVVLLGNETTMIDDANTLADLYLNMDEVTRKMIQEYLSLNEAKQEQVCEYVNLLFISGQK